MKKQENQGKRPERRKGTRLEIDDRTTLTLIAGEQSFRGQVEDISLGGARIRLEEGRPEDGYIVLEHPKAGRLTGHSTWQGDNVIRVTFDLPEREIERTLQCLAIALFADEDGGS